MRTFLFFSLSLASTLACSSAVINDPNHPADGGAADGGGSDAAATNDSGGGGGDAGDPPVANVSLESSCPDITPCGGDVVGTWDYTGGCAEVDFSALKQACPTLTITNASATVKGRVIFSAGGVTRTFQSTGTATVNVPAICAQGAGGCAALTATLQSNGYGGSCASDGAGGCACNVTATSGDTAATTYTVQGNTVVTADGNQYDFCVNGGSMDYTHTTGSSPERGAFTLTKR